MNPACMQASMDKVRCSFVAAAGRELAVVASTADVVAGTEEHAAEVGKVAVVEVNLGGSVLGMVLRHS